MRDLGAGGERGYRAEFSISPFLERPLWEEEAGGHVLPSHRNCSGGWRSRCPPGTQGSPGGGAVSVRVTWGLSGCTEVVPQERGGSALGKRE